MSITHLNRLFAITMCLVTLTGLGCRQDINEPAEGGRDDEAAPAATNRIDIPPSVRQNLGITFVKVERRPVRSTARLPGQFELKPEASRDYHVMLSGRVDLLVTQYQAVAAGDPLFHLDSPEWQRMKSDLATSLSEMRRSHADLAVAEARQNEMEQSIAFLDERLANLADAKVRQVQLESELVDKRNMLPRLQAEVDAARTEFDSSHTRYDVLLSTASSVTGIARNELDQRTEDHGHMQGNSPPWQSIDQLTFYAEASGVVDSIAVTHRGWAETGDLILVAIDPSQVRFHADALQTNINRYANGQEARIVPPQGGTIDLQDTIDGQIRVGYQAHPGQRTIPVFMDPHKLPNWAKPGVTAYLEVFVAGDSDVTLAIPEAAVIRDGLQKVFFRRDPADPNKVIRVEADLGANDSRWVEVMSGVQAGDEIVLGGVYPLMLASSSSGERMKGGHFHADGTFHAGEDE